MKVKAKSTGTPPLPGADAFARLQDGLQEHFGDGVGLWQRLVDDADAGLLALHLLEDDRQVSAAGYARGVERENGLPAAARVLDVAQQALEVWAVIVFSGLYGVCKLRDDWQPTRLRQLDKLAALGVDGNV